MKPLVRRCGFLAVPVICLLVLATPPIAGQSGTAKGEWPSYGADVANTRTWKQLDKLRKRRP